MASTDQENLEVVLVDLFGALRRGDFDGAATLFDPDVTWQGLREEWVCDGREAVLEGFRWGLAERREIEALELTRGRDRVVLGVRGPGLGIVAESSRREYRRVMRLLADRGAECVLFCCTEIDLLVGDRDSPVPVFDTTRLHAQKAVELALR